MRIKVNKRHSFTGHKGAIYALAQMEGTADFYTAGEDGMIVRWNSAKADAGKVIARINSSVYALHSPAGEKILLVGDNYNGIHLIDLVQSKVIKSSKVTSSLIFDIKSVNGRLYVATGDGTLLILDLYTLKTIQKVKISLKSLRSLAINSKYDEIAIGTSENTIKIIDLKDIQLKKTINAHSSSVFSLVYLPDMDHLISAGRDAHLKLWNAGKSYEFELSVIGHMFAINHIVFSPDHKHFATGSMDKTIKIWNTGEFKLLKVIDKSRYGGHSSSVNKLFWSGVDGALISGSDDRTISIWDLEFIM